LGDNLQGGDMLKYEHICAECGAKWKSKNKDALCPRCPHIKKKEFHKQAMKAMSGFAKYKIDKIQKEEMLKDES
jgi:DNA-directed RNA polymerase subunit RPC12/RpoP